MHFDQLLTPVRPTVPLAQRARTLPGLFLQRADATPHRTAWRHKRAGSWVATTWSDARTGSSAIAGFLLERNIGLGDKVTIIGSTRPEWCLCDLGGQLAGAVTVGAYPTLTPEQLAYVLDHSDTRIAFAEGREEVEKIASVKADCPKLELVVVWDADGADDLLKEHDWLVPMSDALNAGVDDAQLEARVSEIDPEETAIIVYTSGTTGPPKGAMISHRNILTILDTESIAPFDIEDEGLTFLPMAHVAERVLAFYGRINHGTSTCYATSVPKVLDELKEVRPTLFGSVPRIFEKAYARIQSEVDKAPPARQKIFRWAEGVAREMVEHWQNGTEAPALLRAQHALADKLVYRKLREVFGGRVKYFITGAAPIPRKILEFFWGAGFPIFEVYGMTEATVVTHTNRPGATRLGSVGQPLPFVEHRLAEDGEILMRGPMVFKGYYKNEAATKETVDEDGWLHTGDIGKIDDDGYLYIVDRKKHIIITAGGKNLTPANIENAIKAEDPIISQVHAHGDRRPYITALITLSPTDSIDWAIERGLTDAEAAGAIKAQLLADPLSRPDGLNELIRKVSEQSEIRERVRAAVLRGNEKLARVEQVKRVTLLDRELSLEEDEITPTMKVKRKNIEKKFEPLFDELYEDASSGIEIVQK